MAQIDLSQYKSLYLKTANEYLDLLTKSIEALKQNPADHAAITNAHLAAHSLGSQSHTMGYTSTEEMARALEAFFYALKENNQPLPVEYAPGIESSVQKIRDSLKSIEQTNKEQAPIIDSQPTPSPQLKSSLSVLLAEDDKFFQNFYAKKLSDQGMKVTVAIDGQDALDKLKNARPDIILLDLIMPRKNGFEVLAEISKIDNLKNIPILVFSTLEQPEDIEKAKSLGARDYANKTFFDFDNLLKKITDLT